MKRVWSLLPTQQSQPGWLEQETERIFIGPATKIKNAAREEHILSGDASHP